MAVSAVGGTADFSKVAAQAVKGVANISSLQVVRTTNSPFGNDPFFRYFFGDDQGFGSRDRRSLSLGSGVIISPDGYVITNNHVVGENVREITVALPDKREIRGSVIGTDPATDIALLKIDAGACRSCPGAIRAAEGRRMGAGDRQPVSAEPDRHRRHRQRHRPRQRRVRRLRGLHPDGRGDQPRQLRRRAVNSRGELVGINTGIFSESGGYQGIGFAVPSNLARKVVGDLMKYGEVRRGSVGYLRVDKLTDQLADEVRSPNDKRSGGLADDARLGNLRRQDCVPEM